jgi:hypothetical protein
MSSSQGPSIKGSVNYNGFAANPPGTTYAPGYAFDKNLIRDASDWIALKKQTLILNEDKTKAFKNPWFVRGNEYRLHYLQGQYKNGNSRSCQDCKAAGFDDVVPFQ